MSITDFAEHLGAARRTVAKWSSRGTGVHLRHDMQAALDTVLARSPEDVRERFTRSIQSGTDGAFEACEPDRAALPAAVGADTASGHLGDLDVDGDVLRRDLLPIVGTAAAGVVVSPAVAAVLDALLPAVPTMTGGTPPMSLGQLDRAAAAAKVNYQACRYEQVLGDVASLMTALPIGESTSSEEDRVRIRVVATDTYHVVGSVLLKLGEPAMAMLAAERSVRYA